MKELLIDWNEYQENNTSFGFQFLSPKRTRESCFTFPFNYAGLYKGCSPKDSRTSWTHNMHEFLVILS